MPRAANASTGALRRNQACRQCRKRKLKCDAQRPHCGTCQKQWAAQISVPPPVGFAHPKEPACTYDPIEGLVLAPDTVEDPSERVRVLEAQIAQLQSKLNLAQVEAVSNSASSSHHRTGSSPPESIPSRSFMSSSPPGHSLPPTGTGLPSNSLYTHPPYDNRQPPYASAGTTRPVPGPTLPPLNHFPASGDGRTRPGSQGDAYYTGLESDVRSTPFNSETHHSSDRVHHPRTLSHPYHRDQPHISHLVRGDRGDGYGNVRISSGSSDGFGSAVEAGVPRVSRLARQSDTRVRGYSLNNDPSAPLYDLMFSGWSKDLPPRHELANYIDIYFRCDPCSSRMLHRPTLLNNLNYPPTHPDFPHPALLHAICATASRYTFRGRLDSALNAADAQQSTVPQRDRFAEFHANKTRAYVNATMSNGQNIFDVFQACVILSWWFYSEGRWVEVWIQAGFQTRAIVPLGLNYLGLIKRGPDGAPVKNPYLAAPKNAHETETRRRAWWMAILFDRIVSLGGWLHSVDERDIGTELPLPYARYDAAFEFPSNPQTLHSENVFTRHPIEYTDSHILFLKSILLFGRITDYTVRMGIRAPLLAHAHGDVASPLYHTVSPGKNTGNTPGATPSGPSNLSAGGAGTNARSPSPGGHARANSAAANGTTDPRNAPGFQTLDKLVAVEFLNSFPAQYRSCLGALDASASGIGMGLDGYTMPPAGGLDTDLYVAHLVPHAATITLHNPWVNYAEPATCPSVARCMEAARAILDKYYLLQSTSFDITLLHPFVTICWYLACVVQIHLCKRLIEMGDVVNEATCWGEINMLRNALITYGKYCPIGTRQEKMLHPIMQEIISMTTQEQPLQVGLPLYPFSIDSAFQLAEKRAAAEANVAVGIIRGTGAPKGHLSGIETLLSASSGAAMIEEEVDVRDAIAPIPDVSIVGEDGDTTMTDHVPPLPVGGITVPRVQSIGGSWMTEGN
ncbi:hypothetical protein PIIN_04099 [Serendipita indica DSM 11827]|uniref:Zn(2)-C6 fungal-type domain-containing protein n=1 Tax=Serendipita indica (strain DSM 11827) TaxID=1109443 RepID=G4TFR3_SERID|nr:hypothetical protein PIIN_04099 [Serendipita indica DSM 11827]